MSYNIDSISYVGEGRLTITPERLRAAIREIKDMPEINIFEELEEAVLSADNEPVPIEAGNLWIGEGSGSTFENLMRALSFTAGTADFVLTWEHGDHHSGLRVVDGVVTEHPIVFALGEKT